MTDGKEIDDFQHILHYCHMCFTPNIHQPPLEQDMDKVELSRWRHASDLYDKGIRFKSVPKESGHSLLDIEFDDGVLRIPTLTIDRNTGFIFANVLAFEQSSILANASNRDNNYFSAYVKFMADLMSSPKDITMLAKKRIIENNLGKDDEVLDLFQALKKGIGSLNINDTYLCKTFDDLEKHYESPSTQYWTDLRRNYCKNPWMIIGVVATILAFIFSGMAAIFNLKEHLRSCNSCN